MIQTKFPTIALKVILEKAWSGTPLTKNNLKYLLSFPEKSIESKIIRESAYALTRLWTENSAAILAILGVNSSACPGGCKFCSFGSGSHPVKPMELSLDEVAERAAYLSAGGDLYALVLQTMHYFNRDRMLKMVERAKSAMPAYTQVWVNVGDTDYETFRELRAAGVKGIYHVCRLREGIDTALSPESRLLTIKNAKEAGLEVFTCCEPIGPEHSLDELVDNIFLGIEYDVDFHAAMRRVNFEGSPMSERGQIDEARLAHITACVALAFASAGHPFVGVHEPNLPGFLSGASVIMSESGSNPRDMEEETEDGRGLNMDACRRLLFRAGFEYLRRGDKIKVPLTRKHIREAAKK